MFVKKNARHHKVTSETSFAGPKTQYAQTGAITMQETAFLSGDRSFSEIPLRFAQIFKMGIFKMASSRWHLQYGQLFKM